MGIPFVGRTPTSTNDVVNKGYADTKNVDIAVTTTIVNNILNTAASALTSKSYVDAQDALRAHKDLVAAEDAKYSALTDLGLNVASLTSSGSVVTGQLPATGLVTDRVMRAYSVINTGTQPLLGGNASGPGVVGSIDLAPGASKTVGTSTLREYRMASIQIPDPGYAWRPLAFAWVTGNSSGGPTPDSRTMGNGSYGLISVMPPSGTSDTVYAAATCTASRTSNVYLATPFAPGGATTPVTPLNQPPINGALELGLYGCCFSGASQLTYTFYGINLQFHVLVVPAL